MLHMLHAAPFLEDDPVSIVPLWRLEGNNLSLATLRLCDMFLAQAYRLRPLGAAPEWPIVRPGSACSPEG